MLSFKFIGTKKNISREDMDFGWIESAIDIFRHVHKSKAASLPLQTNININSNINSSKNVPIAERISLLTLIRFCGATSWCLLTFISFNKRTTVKKQSARVRKKVSNEKNVMINVTVLSLHFTGVENCKKKS